MEVSKMSNHGKVVNFIQMNLSESVFYLNEDMKNHTGVTATATKALSDKHINLEMISQGSSEVSVMFVTQTEHEKQAVRALYKAFFRAEE